MQNHLPNLKEYMSSQFDHEIFKDQLIEQE
jgi:hypothetical protein